MPFKRALSSGISPEKASKKSKQVSQQTYIEAPNEYFPEDVDERSIFLAGGISACENWQANIRELFKSSVPELSLINPRRKHFDVADKSVAEKQIVWEHNHLRKASAVLFWFCKETLCPITLYELGAMSMLKNVIFVGCHPEYQRKEDVIIQTKLVLPDVKVVFSIEELAKQVESWVLSADKPVQEKIHKEKEKEKEKDEDEEGEQEEQ